MTLLVSRRGRASDIVVVCKVGGSQQTPGSSKRKQSATSIALLLRNDWISAGLRLTETLGSPA
jgi:hypothetical protein